MRLPEHVVCGSPIDGRFRMEGNQSALAFGPLEDLTGQERGESILLSEINAVVCS